MHVRQYVPSVWITVIQCIFTYGAHNYASKNIFDIIQTRFTCRAFFLVIRLFKMALQIIFPKIIIKPTPTKFHMRLYEFKVVFVSWPFHQHCLRMFISFSCLYFIDSFKYQRTFFLLALNVLRQHKDENYKVGLKCLTIEGDLYTSVDISRCSPW